MLDIFITSRVRRKIIVIYAKYPDFKTHVRGLAKLIKEDAGNIQRELKRLEKVGFLVSERQGNTKVYSTNKQFPIFRELQSIVLKSQRSAQQKRVTGQTDLTAPHIFGVSLRSDAHAPLSALRFGARAPSKTALKQRGRA
jgi:DNA-binding MarR family transcriptional regulator